MGGISGGERKRTCIAVELITDPSIILLDEPTSGMDSFTAFIIICILKQLALQGKTIVLTIKQPSVEIFSMFDNLFLLMKGRFIYQGKAKDAMLYFRNLNYECPMYYNVCDHFMQLMHPLYDSDNYKSRYKLF